MRVPEKQLATAELKFSYTVYPQFVELFNTHKPSDVLFKLWDDECHCTKQRKYVLFFDRDDKFITWKHLSKSLNAVESAKVIAGIAIACNAGSLMVSHNRINDCVRNHADQVLTATLFNICERVAIEVLDYLIITPQACFSYKEWLKDV